MFANEVLFGKVRSPLFFQLEDLFHKMPFLCRGHGRVAALEAGDVGLPLSLAGESSEAGVVFDEIEVIRGVHDHEDLALKAVDLHVDDADGADSFLDFRPNVTVGLNVVLYHLVVSDQLKGLTVAFHLITGI